MEDLKSNSEQAKNAPSSDNLEKSGEQPPRFLGTTSDGKRVYSRPMSHVHTEDGIDYEMLEEAIPGIETGDKERVEAQIEFDHIIGFDKCIEVGPDDDVKMVYRKNRMGQTPMVIGISPEETNLLQIILKKDRFDQNKYILATTFLGKIAPREPWDKSIETEEERQECEEFWKTHALILDEDLVDWERTGR